MTHGTIDVAETADGPFTIVAADDGAVLGAGWSTSADDVLARIHPTLRPASVREGSLVAADAVRAYYQGDAVAVSTVEVRQHGTVLQARGWNGLREIPPGEPVTYSELADHLGQDAGAVRAVAAVCARNAAALFVPCHRVLRADGSLGGFAWGLEVKRSLLAREGAPGFAALF
ncbi:methylated-DNA--[protein]-cysteine S-methyltransferase [Microbacterium gubbeenense]|uniref:methylated-DNA--[protein]-cysteine S-methyltransferase n=1 Tax=Microbacterium gubbeenense TaxID=159896 RepID=UPI0003F954D8|nr:methylated-DNA--[protein]-cysteine S-methyltransferase [Microbacterium gubbeenense]